MNTNGIEHALFYRSENHDRVYGADSMEYLLKKFFTTGVFVEEFMVTANGGMSVKLGAGYVNIGGKVKVYLNDQELFLETAHATYDRIDSIVLERNDSDRDIFVKVVKGGYSSNPVPLVPVRENGVDQRVVAQIYVAHGAVKITQADITDTRADTFLCGMVAGTVKEIDFSQFTAQFEAFFARYRESIVEKFNEFLAKAENYDANFSAWIEEKKAEITNWQGKEVGDFAKWAEDFKEEWESWAHGKMEIWTNEILDWFQNIRDQLTDDPAMHLQEQIGNLSNLETEEKSSLVKAINSALNKLTESISKAVKKAGDIMTGSLTVKAENVEERRFQIEVNGRIGRLCISANKRLGIYDENNNKWLIMAEQDGTTTLNGTATSARYAIMDNAGYVIKDTYAKKDSVLKLVETGEFTNDTITIRLKSNSTYLLVTRELSGVNKVYGYRARLYATPKGEINAINGNENVTVAPTGANLVASSNAGVTLGTINYFRSGDYGITLKATSAYNVSYALYEFANSYGTYGNKTSI